jgi:8-oxo-dGTP diphosphatase
MGSDDPAVAPDVHAERYTGPVLRVIAAAVVGSRGLLLVSKRAAPDVFFLPGGKPEPGEAPLACLRRELCEELGVGIDDARPFAEVRAPAALEGVRDCVIPRLRRTGRL